MRLADVVGWIFITIMTFLFEYYFLGVFEFYSFLFTTTVIFIYLASAMGINNYFDWKNDASNSIKIKKNPIASGKISRKDGFISSIFLLLIGVVFTAIFLPHMLLIYLLISANTFLYSYKFKSVPVVDLLSHGISIASLFFFPAIVENFSFQLTVTGTTLTFFVSTVAQLENEIHDYKTDKASGVKSTVVKFGIRLSKIIYYLSNIFCFASLLLIFYFLKDIKILLFIPLVVLSAARLDMHLVRRYYEKIFFSYIFILILIILLLSY
jgi:4-hydroxybenzoate polyprenyltransferase